MSGNRIATWTEAYRDTMRRCMAKSKFDPLPPETRPASVSRPGEPSNPPKSYEGE